MTVEKWMQVWVGWIVEPNAFQSGTQVTLKIGSYYRVLKLQKSGLPSTLANFLGDNYSIKLIDQRVFSPARCEQMLLMA